MKNLAINANYKLLEKGVLVFVHNKGTLYARRQGTTLIKSTNYGKSWEVLGIFSEDIRGIFVNDNEEIFVSASWNIRNPHGKGKIYKSCDNGITFKKVLEVNSGAALNWNIDTKNNTMFISEYGIKTGDNARRIYRSLDRGETWETVYNPNPQLNYHCHKLLIAENAVYQSVGDNVNACILSSRDNGDSWQTIIKGFHPTSGIETNSHVLWGLDTGPFAGIAGLNKSTGEMDFEFALPHPFHGPAYDMAKANDVVYAVFNSYDGNIHPGSIWCSKDDGATWQLFAKIEKQACEGVGMWNFTADDKYGYIALQMPVHGNETKEEYVGTLRFELL